MGNRGLVTFETLEQTTQLFLLGNVDLLVTKKRLCFILITCKNLAWKQLIGGCKSDWSRPVLELNVIFVSVCITSTYFVTPFG